VHLPLQGRIGHASIGLDVMFELCVMAMVVINGGLGDMKVYMLTLEIFFYQGRLVVNFMVCTILGSLDTLQGRQVGPQDCSNYVTWCTAVSQNIGTV
jgi:hypothetical protein